MGLSGRSSRELPAGDTNLETFTPNRYHVQKFGKSKNGVFVFKNSCTDNPIITIPIKQATRAQFTAFQNANKYRPIYNDCFADQSEMRPTILHKLNLEQDDLGGKKLLIKTPFF